MRVSLFAVVFTYFLDFVGLFMVVPIFAPTFLDAQTPFLAFATTTLSRTLIIGSLVATYGLAQFLGAPFLGGLSDQYGRKKIICLGLIIFVCGYAIGAYSFTIYNLFLLYLSRFLIGFASGNAAVLFAAVAESSTSKTRGKNIGFLTGAATLGVVVGPVMGSHLIQSSFVSWFHLSTPFWVMAGLGTLNLILILFLFHNPGIYHKRPFSFFIGFTNMLDCFQNKRLRLVLFAYFFFVLSTESVFVSLPIFTIQKFHVTSLYVGYLFLSVSAMSSITSLFFNPYLSKKWSSYQIFSLALTILILLYFFLFLPENALFLLIPFGLAGIFMVLCWTHGNVLASSIANKESQGKVLGVTQSLLSLAILFGPLVIGTLGAFHYNIAVGFSPLSAIVGLLFILKSWHGKIEP